MRKSAGFTLVELLVAVSLMIVTTSLVVFYLYPVRQQQKARDIRRISDLKILSRAIEEYTLNNGSPPDADATTRTSNTLPDGNSGPYESILDGWIDANFTGYLVKVPIDPKNTGSNVYTYQRSGGVYELNAVLERLTEEMTNDLGDSDTKYETGSSLSILN